MSGDKDGDRFFRGGGDNDGDCLREGDKDGDRFLFFSFFDFLLFLLAGEGERVGDRLLLRSPLSRLLL